MLDYPQVALDFMNRDHAEFITLRENLLATISAQAPEPDVDTLLNELLAHTHHHFAEEERLMQETGFPPYAMHKSEHERVLADMSARSEHWKQGRNTVALREWLDRDIGDWFVNHVNSMDFVTAGFINAQSGERT
ncbi:MAG: hemerythrin family protein [Gammaproteobacteria bacterium]|nr:hemerythrin family protein [Gammaproteobacteria bacterium]MBU1480918.1 hemerythrin family protein [Gammaproteobacteria bacterium]